MLHHTQGQHPTRGCVRSKQMQPSGFSVVTRTNHTPVDRSQMQADLQPTWMALPSGLCSIATVHSNFFSIQQRIECSAYHILPSCMHVRRSPFATPRSPCNWFHVRSKALPQQNTSRTHLCEIVARYVGRHRRNDIPPQQALQGFAHARKGARLQRLWQQQMRLT